MTGVQTCALPIYHGYTEQEFVDGELENVESEEDDFDDSEAIEFDEYYDEEE